MAEAFSTVRLLRVLKGRLCVAGCHGTSCPFSAHGALGVLVCRLSLQHLPLE